MIFIRAWHPNVAEQSSEAGVEAALENGTPNDSEDYSSIPTYF